MKTGYILGIDIGGSKYHARAVSDKGTVADVSVPSKGNLHMLDAKRMTKELTALVRSVQAKLKTHMAPRAIVAGISGMDSPVAERELMRTLDAQRWWRGVDPNCRALVNDIVIGLRAGTVAKAAMAIISGTGSNGYGVDAHGNEAWVSGRGVWMAGQGSGYAIGIHALRAVCKAEDGRGPSTQLTKKVFHRFGVRSTQEMMPILYDGMFGYQDIAALSPLVNEAAEEGDRVAREILDHAIEELVLIIDTLHKRLAFGREPVDTVLIGGTINKNRYVLDGLLRAARKRRWMRPIPLSDDPVAGAITLAKATLR